MTVAFINGVEQPDIQINAIAKGHLFGNGRHRAFI
ncbi:Uncharacterised protein [Escherichia coli]|nr:Uncharacterised protein [Escherichia coli]